MCSRKYRRMNKRSTHSLTTLPTITTKLKIMNKQLLACLKPVICNFPKTIRETTTRANINEMNQEVTYSLPTLPTITRKLREIGKQFLASLKTTIGLQSRETHAESHRMPLTHANILSRLWPIEYEWYEGRKKGVTR